MCSSAAITISVSVTVNVTVSMALIISTVVFKRLIAAGIVANMARGRADIRRTLLTLLEVSAACETIVCNDRFGAYLEFGGSGHNAFTNENDGCRDCLSRPSVYSINVCNQKHCSFDRFRRRRNRLVGQL